MIVLVTIATTLAAVLHILIFYMESIAWLRPSVWRRFGLESQEEAQTTQKLAYNQGFYNLFLAIGALLGAILYGSGANSIGLTLTFFSLGSMVAAAIVLITTGKRFIRSAAIQGALPLLALILLIINLSGTGAN
ncbi:DUF1304 domain-containing protein [Lysinibacter sp. HNR]|uniref:DUF1304 domain-containing protein n=1 Tax=Lysinibacter sp. HNR TaxID=3031408 RepID=UPI002435135B|nr:DUF1304 domain-containing protein [Lysinibacter sp. HNR]WGD36678.1 DUF1304 domain-containing protein [Lysinibacter sp. HNR]